MLDTSEKTTELGVFLPVGNGGWITSTTSPQLPATYDYNKQVAILAEEMGFDFALAMAKWRGYGGPSKHWDITLESMTAMAGIAEATSRIGVWGTVHTMVFHPAVVAKMTAVIDQISKGRFGLNIVSGSNPSDQGQMGLWMDLDHAERYELAEEWLTVLKRLWTEERVDHKGKHYELIDCMSNPKPSVQPPIICAGASDRGFLFTMEHCTGSFMLGSDHDDFIKTGLRAKELAAQQGKPGFKTYGLFTIVPGATDAEARERVAYYDSGVDTIALDNQTREYSGDKSFKQNTMAQRFVSQGESRNSMTRAALVGSSETIGRKLAEIVKGAQLDGVTVIVPDFIDDLRTVGTEVVEVLAQNGVMTNAYAHQKAAQ
ncbi:LLM class flavin-dependent oxidoreductase [Paenirhodobacter populi]|uniref:LLM class flavin-dependent oxidoreductase n=1 Tax=Paenirhodobacter populi TaxID=2306993 RepID=UPI000FE2C407|nr:LLM class flavin-dependent oxidoreductase [Sinirhodobacter populi]RWR10306.1 LLM class flavin-dependent oxidoreductase [Sinirhodobacter populi]